MLLPDDLDLLLQQALVIAFVLAVPLSSLIPLMVPEFLLGAAHFDVEPPVTFVF